LSPRAKGRLKEQGPSAFPKIFQSPYKPHRISREKIDMSYNTVDDRAEENNSTLQYRSGQQSKRRIKPLEEGSLLLEQMEKKKRAGPYKPLFKDS